MANKEKINFNGMELQFTPVQTDSGESKAVKKKITRAPGSGAIEISSPVVSPDSISTGQVVTCKTSISGKNIGQIFSDVALQVGENLYGPISRGFLQAPTDREVRGVKHPRWTVENETEFEFIPQIKLLYSGEAFTLACMIPEKYGVEAEKQVWSIEGVYQRGGGEPFRVRFEFDHKGALISKTGFYPALSDGVFSPFELLIEDGDTFEPYASVLEKDGTEGMVTLNPIMLYGGELPHWELSDAPTGTYQIGVMVEDFDGKTFEKHSPVMVK
jgi:hypothetical protein